MREAGTFRAGASNFVRAIINLVVAVQICNGYAPLMERGFVRSLNITAAGTFLAALGEDSFCVG